MLATTLWSVFALVVTGVLMSNFFRARAENDFKELLLAHTYNLMGAVETDASGNLRSAPNLGDPRFLEPSSGWYWAVSTANRPEQVLLSSPSLVRETLQVPSQDEVAFDDVFRRSYSLRDSAGMTVQRLEAQLFFGEGDDLYQVTMSGNRSELEQGIATFNAYLFGFLGLFGIGTISVTLLIMRLGFRPLNEATKALIAVRHGEAERVQGHFPREIEPFVRATNDLIDANRSVLERARTQVGNLAHALKTPLAVIMNETGFHKRASEVRIAEQAKEMRSQIATYLSRAQASAQRRTITARTLVDPVASKLVSTLSKIFPKIDFDSDQLDDQLVFRGEKQDLEEIIGNLLENAAIHARSRVKISTAAVDSDQGELRITIEDDGPGIDKDQREAVLERGVRLDQKKPGSGLGLSIVNDTVGDYGGRLALDQSALGGVRATVYLPRRVAAS